MSVWCAAVSHFGDTRVEFAPAWIHSIPVLSHCSLHTSAYDWLIWWVSAEALTVVKQFPNSVFVYADVKQKTDMGTGSECLRLTQFITWDPIPDILKWRWTTRPVTDFRRRFISQYKAVTRGLQVLYDFNWDSPSFDNESFSVFLALFLSRCHHLMRHKLCRWYSIFKQPTNQPNLRSETLSYFPWNTRYSSAVGHNSRIGMLKWSHWLGRFTAIPFSYDVTLRHGANGSKALPSVQTSGSDYPAM
jgi:hypothetical protein